MESNADGAERPSCCGTTTEPGIISLPGTDDDTCVLLQQMDSKDWIRNYLLAHRQWSETTFGPGPRPEGLVKHIEKELAEIRQAPDDLEEWIDVLILAFDGAMRCGPGHRPDEVLDMLDYKQKKNFGRTYRVNGPDEPNEHIEEGA